MWELNIEGPMAPFGGSPSVMTVSVFSDPSEQAAALMASEILHVSQESIKFQYETEDTKKKECTPLTPSNKPLDKFEFSPNGRATCHTCHERISKHSQRVGIQEWNEAFKHWQPVYYHRDCCTNDMLQSLNLGGKHKRQDDSTNSNSVESKLKAELNRQDEHETTKRRLVYGKRGDLREDLRRMRMEIATQLEVEPYKIFNDATLDDIVAKLPSNERELIKCRGIAQRRCDHYGGAILQVISQYQEMNRDDTSRDSDDGR
jgi:superfamily II DNA helicase RecQ